LEDGINLLQESEIVFEVPVVGDLTLIVDTQDVGSHEINTLSRALQPSERPCKTPGETKAGDHPILNNDLLKHLTMEMHTVKPWNGQAIKLICVPA
jgi:hypothetical protein